MFYNILNHCLNFSARGRAVQTSLCVLPRVLAKGRVLQETGPAISVQEKPARRLQTVRLVLNGVPGVEPEGSAACEMPDLWVWREGGKKMQPFQPQKS